MKIALLFGVLFFSFACEQPQKTTPDENFPQATVAIGQAMFNQTIETYRCEDRKDSQRIQGFWSTNGIERRTFIAHIKGDEVIEAFVFIQNVTVEGEHYEEVVVSAEPIKKDGSECKVSEGRIVCNQASRTPWNDSYARVASFKFPFSCE